MSNNYEWIKKTYNDDGKIYCYCVYDRRDIVKDLGFKWNNQYKLWSIDINKFSQEVYSKIREIRYRNFVYYRLKDNKTDELNEEENQIKSDNKTKYSNYLF